MRGRTTFRFTDRVDGEIQPPMLTTVAAGHAGLPDGTANLVGRLDTCLRDLHDVQRDLDRYLGHRRCNGLPVDEAVMAQLVDSTRQAKRRLAVQQQTLLSRPDLPPERLTAVEPVLRCGVATIAHVRGMLELYPDRSTSDGLADSACALVELRILDVLGVAPGHTVSVTSTGLAAYSLVEGVLLRERLTVGDTVLLAPGVDAAIAAQLRSLPMINVATVPDHGLAGTVASIVDAVRETRPTCVFADPVGATADQRMIDIPELVDRLRSTVTERTTLVVDGTALSGLLPALLPESDDVVEILYYERGPALQLGVDVGVGGVVAHPIALREAMHRQRHNGGLAPHRTSIDLFPRYDAQQFRDRMRASAATTLRAATLLRADRRVRAIAQVGYAGLADHPDAAIAARLGRAGEWVAVTCATDRVTLDRIIGDAAGRARLAGVDITAGGPSGTAPILSIVEHDRPFLRLCPGDLGDQVEVVTDALGAALATVT